MQVDDARPTDLPQHSSTSEAANHPATGGDPSHPTATDGPSRPDSKQLYKRALARVLTRISDHGSATITELVEVAGVSRPTVQRALEELAALGTVREAELRPSANGRPARSWVPAASTHPVMVLDIRREDSRVVLASLTGRVMVDEGFRHDELTDCAPESSPGNSVPELVLRQVATILTEAGIAGTDVLETVIGASGIVADDGTVLLSKMVPGLSGYPLGRRAAELIGLPSVQVENDMNLRAVGELRAGVARGLRSFVYLTDHGFHRPAVVLDGALWHGHHRTVGEGDILSRSGVIPSQLVVGGDSIPYFEVAGRLEAGELGSEWREALHEQLAKVIALLCYVLDPEAVIVHGGAVTTGDDAIADLTRRFGEYAVTPHAPRIMAAAHGPELTVSGAMTLALREALGRTLGLPDPPVPRLHGASR